MTDHDRITALRLRFMGLANDILREGEAVGHVLAGMLVAAMEAHGQAHGPHATVEWLRASADRLEATWTAGPRLVAEPSSADDSIQLADPLTIVTPAGRSPHPDPTPPPEEQPCPAVVKPPASALRRRWRRPGATSPPCWRERAGSAGRASAMPASDRPAPTPIQRRVDAAQATLDRYKDVPFQWGRFDCGRMVAFHLRQIGYRPNLAAGGPYRSLLGARKALKKAGFADLPAALDALGMARIPPAAAAVGDIIHWPSENDLAALGVALGNGRMVAYHPDSAGAAVLQPVEFVSAWRVEILR